MLLWPPLLPQRLLRDGAQFPFADGREFSEMDRGPAKSRGDHVGASSIIPCTISFKHNRAPILESFWGETGGGNLPFLIPDQMHDGYPLLDENFVALLDENDEPLLLTSFWIVKFGRQRPVPRPHRGDMWRASFDLERLA